jgi:hypothetical protein
MTSSGGPGLLTLAVGPADVSVDRSTVNGQGGSTVNRSYWSASPRGCRVGPSGQAGFKGKRKGVGSVLDQKGGAGPAHGPSRFSLSFVVSSACGSAGRLGPRAGWLVLGLDVPWAAVGWRPSPPSPSPPRWLLPLPSFSLTGRAHTPVSTGSGVTGPGSGAAGGCVCVRVGAVGVCECERPEGVRGNVPKAWLRRERDVAATSRGCRARRGRGGGTARQGGLGSVWPSRDAARRGHGLASQRWRARTRAGPGIPGPQRGRAVRGAPASRARGTTRRR